MRDVNQWSNFAKKNMNELDYLREENRLLKENLKELEKRNIINDKNELSVRRLPAWPGGITAYIIAFFTSINSYELKNGFIGLSFFERFLLWFATFYACFCVFSLLYVIFDLFILEKLDKMFGYGFYKKDNAFHFKSLIPHIIILLIALILTFLGPQ